MEGYIIFKKSSCPLFMVDRNKTKRFWWSYSLALAFIFKSMGAAQSKCNSLKYGECKVITYQQAQQIRRNADIKHSEKRFDIEDTFHPQDTYSLGQE